jgi:hypothetical protein
VLPDERRKGGQRGIRSRGESGARLLSGYKRWGWIEAEELVSERGFRRFAERR